MKNLLIWITLCGAGAGLLGVAPYLAEDDESEHQLILLSPADDWHPEVRTLR
jgi:hypothetical protein